MYFEFKMYLLYDVILQKKKTSNLCCKHGKLLKTDFFHVRMHFCLIYFVFSCYFQIIDR